MTMSGALAATDSSRPVVGAGPILVFSINNGAAHRKAAEAIASAWSRRNSMISAEVVEISDFMSPLARFTHVTAYLWLVRHAPSIWSRIDTYQKSQPETSPEWFYRSECRRLFDHVRERQPSALVATEVGCLEMAVLIKRDLRLDIPLIAVDLDYEADRAWVHDEVNLYCIATHIIEKDLLNNGADAKKVRVWGAPLDQRFGRVDEVDRRAIRSRVVERFSLDPERPIVLVSGGAEGLGNILSIVQRLAETRAQIIAMSGNNAKLKRRLERSASSRSVKVLGWTDNTAELMISADLMISKLGLTFYEAMACGLPVIGIKPPPGSELVQYEALDTLGVGLALRDDGDIARIVGELLENQSRLKSMRARAASLGGLRSEEKLAAWLYKQINERAV